MAVPFFSIDFGTREWRAYGGAIFTGRLREGESVDALEKLVSERFPSHYITFLPSARMGFDMLLEAMFTEGDEIIVSAMSFPLFIVLMLRRGIKPVFVDVEPVHYTIDPEGVKKAITPRTRAILVTHLFGHPAQMDAIEELSSRTGIPVLEDCAHSYDSFFKDRETGTFGVASLFSCSVMKVPTTLGGGLLVTKDKAVHDRIRSYLNHPAYGFDVKKTARYFVFSLISILNSYPSIYSLLSHPVFGIIKWRNPALLRKILYSGLGLDGVFSRWERPRFGNYQASVGICQFQRAREMTRTRRHYAKLLTSLLEGTPGLRLPEESADCYWNYQYYVIHVDQPEKREALFDKLFSQGVHVMKEDVWDCTRYPFAADYDRPCPIASRYTPGLIRIQNNSLLKEKSIRRIGNLVKRIANEAG